MVRKIFEEYKKGQFDNNVNLELFRSNKLLQNIEDENGKFVEMISLYRDGILTKAASLVNTVLAENEASLPSNVRTKLQAMKKTVIQNMVLTVQRILDDAVSNFVPPEQTEDHKDAAAAAAITLKSKSVYNLPDSQLQNFTA